VVSLDLDSERLIDRLGRSVVHMKRRNGLKIAHIHRSVAETPVLVVLLAEKGLGGGAIGSGKSCWRNCRRGRSEMGGHWKERRRKSWNIVLAARSARVGRPPEGTPKNEREYCFIEGHKKGGSDLIPC
jgi:hypothetical protein